MDFLRYISFPILFIASAMMLIRWIAPLHPTAGKTTQSLGRWMLTWAGIGFSIPVVLGAIAYMNVGDVIGDFKLIWPFSLGLMALHGTPSAMAVMLVLSVAALENAVAYLVLAALTWGLFSLGKKLSKPKQSRPELPLALPTAPSSLTKQKDMP